MLAHVGVGEDHHLIHREIMTALTKRVLEEGKILMATSQKEIQCPHASQPIKSCHCLALEGTASNSWKLKALFH